MNPVSRFFHRSLARYFWRCAESLQNDLLDHCLAQQSKIEIFQHRAFIHAGLGGVFEAESEGESSNQQQEKHPNVVPLPAAHSKV